jgi:starvation-inducible DNA-binding protein
MADDLYEELVTIQERMAGEESEAEENEPENDESQTEVLVMALNSLLADTYTVYHESHGYHWNVKGPDFSQYHGLFGSIYEDMIGSVDGIAENVLRLGYDSPHKMSDLMRLRTIPEASPNDTPQSMSTALLSSVQALHDGFADAFEIANAIEQQGVANFLAERIDMTSKWMWQLRASLGMQKPALLRRRIPMMMN